jgi:uncharacterized protein (TIGR03066 family)
MVNIMNNGKVLDKEQKPAAAEQPAAAPAAPKPARNVRVVLVSVMLLLFLGAFGLTYIVSLYVLPRVPRELVGTWQVVEGDMKGATLEFSPLGSGSATMFNKQGKKEVAESSVRVRGKRIFMTYKAPGTGQEDKVIQTIVKLTDDELVIRDQDQTTYKMIRISD